MLLHHKSIFYIQTLKSYRWDGFFVWKKMSVFIMGHHLLSKIQLHNFIVTRFHIATILVRYVIIFTYTLFFFFFNLFPKQIYIEGFPIIFATIFPSYYQFLKLLFFVIFLNSFLSSFSSVTHFFWKFFVFSFLFRALIFHSIAQKFKQMKFDTYSLIPDWCWVVGLA